MGNFKQAAFVQAMGHRLASQAELWLALVVIAFLAWTAAKEVEDKIHAEVGNALSSVLATTHQAVSFWAATYQASAERLATIEDLRADTASLLEVVKSKTELVSSPALLHMRHDLAVLLKTNHYHDYYIVAPANINIVSSRDDRVGVENVLVKQQPDVLDTLWSGQSALSRPLQADVPLQTGAETTEAGSAILFVGAPIRDQHGDIIALLMLQLDPAESLYPLLRQGRLAKTGHAFAFDSKGLLLTETRFTAQLRKLGLTGTARHSALHVELRDPGVDLRRERPSISAGSPRPFTQMAMSAIRGGEGTNLAGYRDVRGVPVVGAWLWDAMLNMGFAVEQDASEAYSTLWLIKTILYTGASLVGVILLTLRWRSEQRKKNLHAAEVRLHAIFNAAVDGIVVINGEGQIENVNHALTELFGYTAQELLGRNVAMLMPEPHRHQHDDYLRQFNATGKAKVIGIGREVEGRRKDGSLFPVDLSVSELMLAGKRYFVGVIHDITMHKAMESALAEERNFNRLTLDSLLAGIVVLDEKSYILSVNEAWRRLAEEQVATGDLVGCNYLAVCDAATGTSPEQTQAVAEGLRDILSGTQQTFSLEYPCHGPSGQRWFLMRASHFLEAGRPRVVVSHQDITARVVAEESLKRANAQLKMLAMVAQRTSNSVIVTDREGRIVWVNEGFTTSSEYTLQEVMGRRPPEILVGPDSDREVVARLDAAARQGQKIEAEILNYSKSGRRYWVQVEITPILDENGEVEEFIALERDITEQRRLLADLKIAKEGAEHIALDLAKNERLLMLTLSGAGAGFWYFEFATGIMRWDKPSRQIFAVGEEDLSGRYEDWATNMHPEDFPMAQGAFIDALADETVSDFTIDHRVIWPSGEIRYIHVAATIDRDNAREPCSVSGLYFDDTERKRNEAALQQAKDEAEAANRAKSAFLAAMSHEIRTPMNGVVGMIDVLAQTSLTADQQDSLRTIKDSAFSLLAIIDDILDFSKIEAGRLTLERVPVAIEDLVEGVGDTLLPMALKKNIELLVSCDPNIPVAVSTDPVRLRQVLLNLGGNAIKFTGNDSDRKGRVVIRANLEAVRNNRVRLLLRVEDNGIGMSEEVQARLFRPFGQGESSTTRRFGGTGLGLTICRRLVEMMDGRLEMESREGEGSVFSVRLEFAEVPTETEQAADDLTGIGVLLVTSERTVYSICESYLSQMGVPVVGMESAGEMAAALRALSESHDQVVVILDCPGVPRSLQQKQNQERNRALRQRLRQVCTECKPRFLQLERGRRRYPRQNEEDTLSFDLDAMHRETFLHALALVVGRSSAQTANAATPKEEIVVRTPLGLAEAEARGQLILVAEDNETNQKVLLHQLSMLGYTAEIAGNGREALEKWRQVPYGLILTDYHMPEMDGYELAQAIREEEGDKRRYTPIMAITADAFKDTQRRCMACGMDDYIAKPVQLRPLQEKLRWWLPDAAAEVAGSVSDGQEEADAEARDTTQVVDPNALKEVLGVDDPEMLADFYNDFLVTAQQTLDAIADACNTRDAAAAGALGHRLKSSARTVGANTLADCCFELEQAGKAADWVAIDAQVAELPPLLQAVQAWIQRRQ